MNLKEWLLKNNISQSEFAKKIGLGHRYHFNKIVQGHLIPSLKLAKKIEDVTEGEIKAVDLLFLSIE